MSLNILTRCLITGDAVRSLSNVRTPQDLNETLAVLFSLKNVDEIDKEELDKAIASFMSTDLSYGLRYNSDTYRLFDLLGFNGLFFDATHRSCRLPRSVVTTDDEHIPLPRDIDYTSKIEGDNIAVPFTAEQVRTCIREVLDLPSEKRSVSNLRLLEFLDCHHDVEANLTIEEWKKVLTFEPCFEQRMSGFRFERANVLTHFFAFGKGDGYTTHIYRNGDQFEFVIDGPGLHTFRNAIKAAMEIGTVKRLREYREDVDLSTFLDKYD